jgi:hypothetical protein
VTRQDINLLIGAPGPGRSSARPTARQFAVTLLALVLCGIVAGAWQESRRTSLERAVQVLNSDIDAVIVDLEERSQFFAERNADPALVAELKRREREADDKTRVLDLLSGESVGNAAGFSAHLTALGRRHPAGLWLETIRFAEGGRQLMLAGRTLHASLVPKFLAGLQMEPALAGTAFATFTMSDDDHGDSPMAFALATGCALDHTGEEGETPEACVPFEILPAESLAAKSSP